MGFGKSRRQLRTIWKARAAGRLRVVGGGLAVALGIGVLGAEPAHALVPEAPTNVSAVAAGLGSATVSWTPAGDGGSPLTGFLVAAQPSAIGLTVDDPTQTSATITGLPDGTYTFTVRARNADGRSLPSLKSPAVTITGGSTVTVPDPPVNVSATPGVQSATVSWTPPANDGGWPITDYKVNVNPGKGVSMPAPGDATSLVFTGLTSGVEYTFTVQAGNDLGRSANSAPSNVVTPTEPMAVAKDFTGDGKGDIIGRKLNGELWLYRGNGTGGVGAYNRIGTGWQVFDRILSTGDFSGDGKSDVLARRPNGELWLYSGNGGGGWAAAGRRISTGWQTVDRILSTGDFSGDGKSDIIARRLNGELWLYRGNGGGGIASYSRIGTGWQAFDRIFSTGDFTGDGNGDVLARKPNGELWLFAGNGAGGWAAAGRRISTGWQAVDRLFSAGDFSGDGKSDVLARRPNGELWLYRGNGGGGFSSYGRASSGWQVYDILLGVGV
ncbi:fibronectin type III domain-containing protein [Knoellia sp. p5-6-4]|uniref:fibronectin type III domain-containing protein n=1 Tax=unclassified Knoellia TaxID=2618719 RepID=UPI0023DBE9C2|nr:FG-GAP-like repeat-containing protein [Knoellia sp. p5-6-4]MDF2144054.1 fibronectin type III domain-containing protein [Knoellia sp. p5-6-4]